MGGGGEGQPCYQGEFLPSSHLILLQCFPPPPPAQRGTGWGGEETRRHGMGFLLPELTRLQMASGVGYHPLQEVLLTVLCYFAGPKMDSSRRAGLIAASPGRVKGTARVLRGELQPGPLLTPNASFGRSGTAWRGRPGSRWQAEG